jgi:non-specific serine/threonine protein kinase
MTLGDDFITLSCVMSHFARIDDLPPEPGPLVGRSREVTAARRLLSRSPLVTLTGPGGVGKTRVALRVARQVRRAFDDVLLADWTGVPDGVSPAAVLATLLTPAVPQGAQAGQVLLARLEGRRMLLLLDSCEARMEDVAALAHLLLRSCPALRLLATSREPLRVTGEAILTVPPLELPLEAGPVRELSAAPAVALYLRQLPLLRARRSPGAVAVVPEPLGGETPQDVVAAAGLCSRLDGLPLAIELAAAVRPGSGSGGRQLYRELNTGVPGPVERHRTVRACFAWSHARCSPREQLVWARLAVFEGPFELGDVEAVCAGEDLPARDLLDIVVALVDKSVLTRQQHGAVVRYRLLGLIRAFGADELDRLGAEQVRRRHRDHYLNLAARATAEGAGLRQREWLTRWDERLPDLRAALERGLGELGNGRRVLLATTGMSRYWALRGCLGEGRRWLENALAGVAEPGPARSGGLLALAALAALDGDPGEARVLLAGAGTTGTGRLGAGRDVVAGLTAALGPEPADAVAPLERALAQYRSLRDAAGHADTLGWLSLAFALAGDPGRAAACHQRLHGCPVDPAGSQAALSAWALALAAWRQGAADDAAEQARQSLRAAHGLGHLAGVARCLEVLAWVAVAADPRRAATLLGAAGRAGTVVPASLRGDHERCERAGRAILGGVPFEAALAHGRIRPLGDVVADALGGPGTAGQGGPGTGTGGPGLTQREAEVAELIGQGLTNRQIADRLVIAQRTAEGHVESIMAKLGVSSRTQAAAWLARQPAPPARR